MLTVHAFSPGNLCIYIRLIIIHSSPYNLSVIILFIAPKYFLLYVVKRFNDREACFEITISGFGYFLSYFVRRYNDREACFKITLSGFKYFLLYFVKRCNDREGCFKITVSGRPISGRPSYIKFHCCET